jgi:ceramide synthetase
MIQLGVHLFSLFEMVVIKRKSERKFYEFVLHHTVAASLILFSTMSNQIAAGAMILIVHDASDILMAFGRFFIETKYNSTIGALLFYVTELLIWIWLRIIVFPLCLLANVYDNRPTPTDPWSMISF